MAFGKISVTEWCQSLIYRSIGGLLNFMPVASCNARIHAATVTFGRGHGDSDRFTRKMCRRVRLARADQLPELYTRRTFCPLLGPLYIGILRPVFYGAARYDAEESMLKVHGKKRIWRGHTRLFKMLRSNQRPKSRQVRASSTRCLIFTRLIEALNETSCP